jgi:hypothetical protein
MSAALRRDQAFRDTVRRERPMGAARIVRRERYAWPGGYPLALYVDDGGLLCPACVTEHWPQISWSHRTRARDGWAPVAIVILDDPEAYEADASGDCCHCGKRIGGAA